MAVSVRDVAGECGVSPQSVSHALRDKGRLSPETRQRIKEAALRMGYRPNSIARTMRTGRFMQVGVLSHAHAGSIHHNVIKGVCRELEQHEIAVVVAEVERQSIGEPGKGPKLLRELSSDGLIVDYANDIPPEVIDAVESAGVPVIWVNANSDHNAVTPDDAGAGRTATELLLRAGHRRIGFVHGESAMVHHSARDRLAGFRSAMSGHAEPCECVMPDGQARSFEGQMDFWVGLLTSHDRLEALVVHDYRPEPLIAARRLVAAMGTADVDIPIVGISGATGTTVPGNDPCLQVPWVQVGRSAARMLLKAIASPRKKQPVELVPFSITDVTLPQPSKL